MSTPAGAQTEHGGARSTTAAWAERVARASAHDTLVRRFLMRAATTPDDAALVTLAAGGAAADATTTWGEWASAARTVAAALVAGGLGIGERVAVLGGNRTLWPIADLGVLLAGGVTVGIFPTSLAPLVAELLRDSGARIAIADTAEQGAKLTAAPASTVRTIVCDARCGDDGRVVQWSAWLAAGAAALRDPAIAREVDERAAAVSPADVAALIYTSGSTGEPKGACVSHAYLLSSAESIRDTLGLRADDSSLSILPFAHASERVFGQATRIVCGMTGALVADATRVWEAARAFRPTLLGGLPRFYERIHAAVVAAERAASGAEAEAWARLRAEGARRSAMRRAGTPTPDDASWRALRAPAEAVLAQHVGDRLRLATSGGAPLPVDVAESLDAVGLTVLGGYGQTEHLCVAFHRPDGYRFDGVGAPMPGTELRIDADGEVLVRRCALTFSGYLNKPEATAAAFTSDGAWLRTGDLGHLDARGRLHVTGRKKEILALSTGKKVAPLPIERRLAEHQLVSHAVLYGEGRRFVTALLFVSAPPNHETHDALTRHVERVNAELAPHERVARWLAIHEELTVDGGDLTPTLKVRRGPVTERFRARLEALYA